MKRGVDWYYRRNNCDTCAKSDAYLARARVSADRTQDARKERFSQAEILELARAVDHIAATRGTAVITIDIQREKPGDEALLKLLMGPSGNLRAPAIRSGKTLLVGFSPKMFDAHLRG